ncbi:MAG: hypothetical protein ABIG10_03525 [bacterium]
MNQSFSIKALFVFLSALSAFLLAIGAPSISFIVPMTVGALIKPNAGKIYLAFLSLGIFAGVFAASFFQYEKWIFIIFYPLAIAALFLASFIFFRWLCKCDTLNPSDSRKEIIIQ